MAARTTRKMSDRHEDDLVAVLGGERTRNSGAVWSDQGDVHQTGMEGYYRFGMDGKSTLGKSISISREMLEKLREQSRGLEPALPLRWYRDDRLTMVDEDWIAIELDTFAQMQADANAWRNHLADNDDGIDEIHLVKLAEDGFTIQHPVSERRDGTLFECDYHKQAQQQLTGEEKPPGIYGCYLTSDGVFEILEEVHR